VVNGVKGLSAAANSFPSQRNMEIREDRISIVVMPTEYSFLNRFLYI
jgi:hypothetical protein